MDVTQRSCFDSGMLTAKDAARLGVESMRDLYEADLSILLEEVEKEGDYWLVTLSFPAPRAPIDSIGRSSKEYKQFKIHAVTGAVESMKIRKI